MIYDIKQIDTWEAPEENGVKLLTMSNIPAGLFGCAPRVYMGQSKWDLMRKKCYMEANYTCQICGANNGHGNSDCHEVYSYDYKNAKAEFVRPVCLCKSCHAYIHSGRLLSLYTNKEQGALSKMQMLKLVSDRFALIDRWNRNHPNEEPLRVSVTFLDWAKNPTLKTSMEALFESYNVKFAKPYEPKKWPIWTLKVNDKVYESPYTTRELWEQKFVLNGRVE